MKAVRVINLPRSEDLRQLEMLQLNQAGWSYAQIGARFGEPRHVFRDFLKRMRRDDMAEPDPNATPEDYKRAYP